MNGRIEAYVDVDLEKFAGWKGGTFHANGYYIYGDGPSTKRLGNIFAVSNIEALETLRLFEIWIQQGLPARARRSGPRRLQARAHRW